MEKHTSGKDESAILTAAIFQAIIKSVIVIAAIILGVFVTAKLGSVIGVLVIATLIVISVESMVKYFMRGKFFGRNVTRGFAVLLAYALILMVLGFVVTVVLPPFVGQLQKLIQGLQIILPQFAPQIETYFKDMGTTDLVQQVTKLSGNVWDLALGAFSTFTTLVSLFILSIYMSLDWENIKKGLLSFFPDNIEDTAHETVVEVENSVGQWVKGELFLMLVVGLFCYIGLAILGVPYAIPLALVSGLLEVVPIIGPVMSAVIAGIVGFSDSPLKGFGVIGLYLVVQQAENNLLVPKIMQQVSGFSPLIVMIALLVGSSFFGTVGAIMAVPATMVGAIVLKRVMGV